MDKFQVLREFFGHESFRSGQEQLIDNILSGRDVLGIMPTGAGKSLCYQVPALMLRGITVVVSPLISLMKDQVSALVSAGVSAACINSAMTAQEYYDFFRRASAGEYRIIYAAPERLATEEFLRFAENTSIAMVTVDEAHCVSQWGQDFRPSYLHIIDFIERLSYRPVVSAFTATATSEVRDDIVRILRLNDPFVITTGFDRPNLYFAVMNPGNKYQQLVSLIKGYGDKCGIVYCLARKTVEEVCEKLNSDGFSATRYHAGLSAEERQLNQEEFIYDRCRIMVATNAFGMGIDKSDVRYVIHYNMPKNLESYYQEAGRAGRDGENSECTLLYSPMDVRTNQFLIDNSREADDQLDPEVAEEVRRKDIERLKFMTFYSTTSDCLRHFILRYFGENSPENCGNCSCCLIGHETTDITLDAKKIISCVYRVHQIGREFGKTMICDILRGNANERLMSLGLDRLSTYGIMKEDAPKKIRSEIDFLVQNGYLSMSEGDYPVLRLSAESGAVLRGEKELTMRLPKVLPKAQKKAREKQFFADDELFEMLRKLRKSLAEEENKPAYIVFDDSALRDMRRKMPTTKEEFLEVSGVGKVKAEKYSKAFCGLIKEYKRDHPDCDAPPEGETSELEKQLAGFREQVAVKSPVTAPKAWSSDEEQKLRQEFDDGLSLADIAKAHKRTRGAISARLKKLGLLA